MKLSELILAVGDDNIKLQNLDQSSISLDWSIKKGGKITFGTEEEIIPGEGTRHLGLVLWLPRDRVDAAVAAEKTLAAHGNGSQNK